MRLEKVDGFFAALIAGPVSVWPAEYWPAVFGCELRYLMQPAHTDLDAILTLLDDDANNAVLTPTFMLAHEPESRKWAERLPIG